MAKTRPRNRPRAAIQEPRFSKATIKPRFSEATIEVVSVSSSGLPTYYPKVTPGEAVGFLHKAAAKFEDTGDLQRFINDVFSCGWPDVALSIRQHGPSGKHIPAVGLQICPLGPESQHRQGDSSTQPARSY